MIYWLRCLYTTHTDNREKNKDSNFLKYCLYNNLGRWRCMDKQSIYSFRRASRLWRQYRASYFVGRREKSKKDTGFKKDIWLWAVLSLCSIVYRRCFSCRVIANFIRNNSKAFKAGAYECHGNVTYCCCWDCG